jgi:hypothetical protein
MASVFRSGLCLPPLFYEILHELCNDSGVTAVSMVVAYQQTFGEDPTADTLEAILKRLNEEALEAMESAPKEASGYKPKTKQSFATAYTQYLQSLNVEGLCFLLADFDPEKAKKLYCSTDMKLIESAGVRKVTQMTQDASVAFEAVLFGMGGHYKGAGPNDTVIDLTEDASAAKDAFRQLGLM